MCNDTQTQHQLPHWRSESNAGNSRRQKLKMQLRSSNPTLNVKRQLYNSSSSSNSSSSNSSSSSISSKTSMLKRCLMTLHFFEVDFVASCKKYLSLQKRRGGGLQHGSAAPTESMPFTNRFVLGRPFSVTCQCTPPQPRALINASCHHFLPCLQDPDDSSDPALVYLCMATM